MGDIGNKALLFLDHLALDREVIQYLHSRLLVDPLLYQHLGEPSDVLRSSSVFPDCWCGVSIVETLCLLMSGKLP